MGANPDQVLQTRCLQELLVLQRKLVLSWARCDYDKLETICLLKRATVTQHPTGYGHVGMLADCSEIFDFFSHFSRKKTSEIIM